MKCSGCSVERDELRCMAIHNLTSAQFDSFLKAAKNSDDLFERAVSLLHESKHGNLPVLNTEEVVQSK